ncbi:Glycine--tRNA ligase [Trichinella sp. T9]|nr:Glycine--tRNA ligase [Trichinella sp. T9]
MRPLCGVLANIQLICRRFTVKEKFSRKRQVLLSLKIKNMQNPSFEEVLVPLRKLAKEQGNTVQKLKDTNAPAAEIQKAIQALKLTKESIAEKEQEFASNIMKVDRFKMEDLLKRRFFYDQSFAIYGGLYCILVPLVNTGNIYVTLDGVLFFLIAGVTGLYDYGPVGCAMKANLLQIWRNHFIIEENMLEVDCSMLTPEQVLMASGHVDRFCDYMVKDVINGECFRADHLIKAHVEKVLNSKKSLETCQELTDILARLDGFSGEDIANVIKKFQIKSPTTGNNLSEPVPFNLMFGIQIGPTGLSRGFLRPETAQGIFVNFKRLLQFNQGKLPFAAAQIGNSFRNEISPRQGLIRVREFTMAEIEHFVDPSEKAHPKFHRVANERMVFFSACNQVDGNPPSCLTIGEAVRDKLVANETLGYYIARVYQFLLKVGVDPNKLRFRQHMSNEMAHYATDCWDAECYTTHGWIECVGIADRSCYDLTQHSKATGVRLVAEKRLPEPRQVEMVRCIPDKRSIWLKFKADGANIIKTLENLDKEACLHLQKQFESTGHAIVDLGDKCFELENNICKIEKYMKAEHVEEIVPSVVEPSFGIGRVLYAIFEHSFRVRDNDEQRTYFSVPAIMAPYKCCILPLSANVKFDPLVEHLSDALRSKNISHKVDDSSGSIGRRYARTDEIAIPFAITVDFDSLLEPHTATLRERDTMHQVRVPLSELPTVVEDLSSGKVVWSDVMKTYPVFEQQEGTVKK